MGIVVKSGFHSLTEAEKETHREKIGIRARSILTQFWQSSDTEDVERVMEVEGWMDVLEECSHSEIRFAWRDYQLDKKNRSARGRLVKPDAGALMLIILSKRVPKKTVVVSEPLAIAREPISAQRAQEILDENGFHKIYGFGGYKAKKFPEVPKTPKSHLKVDK